MKKVGLFIGDWWRLVVPYFKSEERWIAIALLVGAISLTFAAVGLEVLFNDWNRRFYDSLQNKDEATFWREITIFGALAAGFIAVGVSRAVVSPYLRLRWRRWLTRRYLAHWLDGRGYYRIELQRIDRQCRPAHRRGSAAAWRIHHAAPAGLSGRDHDADLVPVHPVEPLGAAVAGADRPRHHDSRLHGLGVPDLRHRRHLLRKPGRAAADPAQLPAAALRGQLPLRPGARARECRGHRALPRRGARGRGPERALRRRLRQRLAGAVHPGAACPLPGLLQSARHHLPLHRDGARLLCRRHHARRDDADGIGLRPGADRLCRSSSRTTPISPSCAP